MRKQSVVKKKHLFALIYLYGSDKLEFVQSKDYSNKATFAEELRDAGYSVRSVFKEADYKIIRRKNLPELTSAETGIYEAFDNGEPRNIDLKKILQR